MRDPTERDLILRATLDGTPPYSREELENSRPTHAMTAQMDVRAALTDVVREIKRQNKKPFVKITLPKRFKKYEKIIGEEFSKALFGDGGNA
jgi:hypothetical protein